jgi:hypothetical protein
MDDEGNNQFLDQKVPMTGIYEEPPVSKDPPKATLARRAKSYSDFYEVAVAYLDKETHKEASQNSLDIDGARNQGPLFEERYADLEDELLDASHEEYQ